MGKNIDAYKKYLKKCEMLGVKTFEFVVNEDKDEVYIIKYISNNEPERVVKIPDFVSEIPVNLWDSPFEYANQNIKIVGGQNLKSISFRGYKAAKIDISGLDTSRITDMSYMFNCCRNLEEIDVSRLDTGNTRHMTSMFEGCSKVEKLEISNFNTSRVRSMASMFEGCANIKELNISNFNTDNVNYMQRIFANCSGLEKLDIGGFDNKNLENMYNMFNGCQRLKIIITNKKFKELLEKNREKTGMLSKVEILEKK